MDPSSFDELSKNTDDQKAITAKLSHAALALLAPTLIDGVTAQSVTII